MDEPSPLNFRTSLRLLQHQIIRQPEPHNRLRRNIDVPITRHSANRRPRAAASQSADQQPGPARSDARRSACPARCLRR